MFLSLFNIVVSSIKKREQKLSILTKVNWLPWFSYLTCITSIKHIINLNSWGLERLQSCTLQRNILNLANLFNPWVQKDNIDNEVAPILNYWWSRLKTESINLVHHWGDQIFKEGSWICLEVLVISTDGPFVKDPNTKGSDLLKMMGPVSKFIY